MFLEFLAVLLKAPLFLTPCSYGPAPAVCMCIFPLAIFINNWVSVAPRWSCKDGKAGKAGNPMRALLLGRSLGNPIGALGETLEISIGPPLARKNAGNPCWAPPWLEKTLEILTGPVLDRQALLILGTTILGTTDFDRLTCRQKATCGNLVYIYMCIYIYMPYVYVYLHVCICISMCTCMRICICRVGLVCVPVGPVYFW